MTFMKFTGKKELHGIRKKDGRAISKKYTFQVRENLFNRFLTKSLKKRCVRKNIGLTVCMLLALTASGCSENKQNEAEVQNTPPTMDIGEPHGSAGDNQTAESEELGKQLAVEYLEKKLGINEQYEDIKALFDGLNTKEAYEEILKTIQTDNIDYVYLAFEDDSFHILPKQELPPNYVPSDRPWYKGAIEDGHYEDEYIDSFSEKLFYSIAEPVGNENIGQVILGIDFVLENDLEKAQAYSNYIFNEFETSDDNKQEDFGNNQVNKKTVLLSRKDIIDWEEKISGYSENLESHMDEESLKALLVNICDDNAQVITAYIASPEGSFYISEDLELPQDYDPRQRPWYKAAIDENGLYVAQPYEDITTGHMVTSISMELDKAPQQGWVLGIDLSQDK